MLKNFCKPCITPLVKEEKNPSGTRRIKIKSGILCIPKKDAKKGTNKRHIKKEIRLVTVTNLNNDFRKLTTKWCSSLASWSEIHFATKRERVADGTPIIRSKLKIEDISPKPIGPSIRPIIRVKM